MQGNNVLIRHKALLNFLFIEVPCPEGFHKAEGGKTSVKYKDYYKVYSIQECGKKIKEHGFLYMSYHKMVR